MVLDHVPHGSGLFVVRAPVLHAEVFGDGDLDMVDVAPVPDGFEEGVGETECEDVLYGLLPEVMIDPVDLGFVERGEERLVEFVRGIEIVAERLFEHKAGTLPVPSETRFADALDDRVDQIRRDGEIENVVHAPLPLLFQLFDGAGELRVGLLV